MTRENSSDVLVLGAGHNGLVAAVFLARAGLKVTVLEEKATIGGACKTERPFARAPNLATSTGAYLLGLMPPELVAKLGIDIPTVRRDPHYFLPTTDGRSLLFGSDREAMRHGFARFFSERDWRANEALQSEIAQIRDDIAPTWLEEPRSIEETAERYVRPALRQVFVELCRRPIADYLARFDFQSDLLRAMYAVTDGFSGSTGTWSTPGTGMNFLVHNMCRIPGSGGTFMLVRGGMGTVTARIGEAARAAGAAIETDRRVTRIVVEGGAVRGVVLDDGRELYAETVVCNADPFRMRDLVDRPGDRIPNDRPGDRIPKDRPGDRIPKDRPGDRAVQGRSLFPEDYNRRIDAYLRDGTTLKVNLALRGLPKFSCLAGDAAQAAACGPTIHLLPDERDVLASLERSFADVQAGRLPDFPTIEWYIHTTLDAAMRDEHGHHNSALFVQWVPYALSGGKTWETEEAGYVKHLLSICDRFAPGTSDLVVDVMALPPHKIEQHFGITRGHIHHVDNQFGFADRLPYATPIAGLYSASAGTHPAGSVIGCAGHNAAMRVLRDRGRA